MRGVLFLRKVVNSIMRGVLFLRKVVNSIMRGVLFLGKVVNALSHGVLCRVIFEIFNHCITFNISNHGKKHNNTID